MLVKTTIFHDRLFLTRAHHDDDDNDDGDDEEEDNDDDCWP